MHSLRASHETGNATAPKLTMYACIAWRFWGNIMGWSLSSVLMVVMSTISTLGRCIPKPLYTMENTGLWYSGTMLRNTGVNDAD